MNTPICDFVRQYARSNALRMHMPAHKGKGPLGVEALDITEISGADSLYEASGIIAESEKNASGLFGCETFYSTEGSSLCIRAMLYLLLLHAKQRGQAPCVLAARNVHKSFLSAAALLDLDVRWLQNAAGESYLSCRVELDALERAIEKEKPAALYLTSPDYLGNTQDIAAIAALCHQKNVLLLVDNAHGAYLKFLPQSMHPIDLGADVCCDSAHKTLPVLTGGAYLHIGANAPKLFREQARSALAMFGSTSPSYLILQSLDAANARLSTGYRAQIARFAEETQRLRQKFQAHGYVILGDEPMKLTLAPKRYGWRGTELSRYLLEKNISIEFADPDFAVLMPAPDNGVEGLTALESALTMLPRRKALPERPPEMVAAERVMSVREACFSACETIPSAQSEGRVLARASVGCPPAVPIVICGEKIHAQAVECFRYYGVENCTVVK